MKQKVEIEIEEDLIETLKGLDLSVLLRYFKAQKNTNGFSIEELRELAKYDQQAEYALKRRFKK